MTTRLLRISGLVIASNEAGRIESCVRSLSFCDEVVVVDGGSRDETVARARAAGARVVSNPWPGFARQRRFALTTTDAEWILFLDADEAVPPDAAEEIRAVVEAKAGGPDGYLLPRRSDFLGRTMRYGAWRNDAPLRLARRARVRIPERRVHERLEVEGTIGRLVHPILHDAQPDFATVARKFHDYLDLSVSELLEKRGPSGVASWEVFLRPPAAFVRDAVLRLGFLDGWRGLALAGWNAASVLARYAEARRRHEARA